MSKKKESETDQDQSSGGQGMPKSKPNKESKKKESKKVIEDEVLAAEVSAREAAGSAAVGQGPVSGTSQAAPARSGGGLALLALVVAIAGIAGGYLLWQQLMTTLGPLDQRTAKIEQHMAQLDQQGSRIGARLDQLDQRMSGVEGQVKQLASRPVGSAQPAEDIGPRISAAVAEAAQSLDKKLDEKIARQTAAFQQDLNKFREALSAGLAARRHSWKPAEAAYLIGIANDSLQLRRDVSTAVSALSSADQRLKQLGDPAFAKTRRLLADEMTALLAVPKIDIGGAASALSAAEERIASLPLVNASASTSALPAKKTQEAEPSTTARSGWRGFLQGIWQALKELVTVRRREASDEPPMAPAQQRYLAQNIQLKLETARLALLSRDDQTYHASLAKAQEWVGRYYQADDAAVSDLLKSLQTLDKLHLQPEIPSVNEALTAINEVMASRAYLPEGSTRFQSVGAAQPTKNGGK